MKGSQRRAALFGLGQSSRRLTPPHDMTNTIPLIASALYIYPVKSCAPVSVESLTFDDCGLLIGDREWAVVDENSCLVWQGSHPRLALVHPEFEADTLTLRNRNGDFVHVGPPATHAPSNVSIWNDVTKQIDVFAASDAGDDVAAFLQRTVGARFRLVRLGREARLREGSRRVHIVSRTSFEELAADLPLAAQRPEHLLRFRPNIVVTGCSKPLVPFLEEQFTKLAWADDATAAALEVSERCVRCIVPNVDPSTGREDAPVLEVVSKHSATRYPNEAIYFGVYASSTGASTLKRCAALEASLAL